MPGASTDHSTVVTLPADYQTAGGAVPDPEEWVEDGPSVEELPEATIESWLTEAAPVEEWVAIPRRNVKVLLRGLTEGERQDIEKSAPRKMNKQTKRPEPDQNWINMELVRRSLVKPAIPNNDLLKKALAGELAYLAGEIGRLSGFEIGGDALE